MVLNTINNNKSGQAIFLALMLAVAFFFIGLIVAPAIKSSIDSARTTMDCSNSSIDTSQKVNCTITDLVTPYVVGVIFALAGGLISAIIINRT